MSVTNGRPGRPGDAAGHAHHPAVTRELARAEDLQLWVADVITRFAGSMPFVYVHVVAFVV